jgi:hypothetical protein
MTELHVASPSIRGVRGLGALSLLATKRSEIDEKVGHCRAESLSSRIDRHERGAGLAHICPGRNLSCHSRQLSFWTAHDEDVVWPSRLSRAIATLLEERDREVQDLSGRHPADGVLLHCRSLQLFIDLVN